MTWSTSSRLDHLVRNAFGFGLVAREADRDLEAVLVPGTSGNVTPLLKFFSRCGNRDNIRMISVPSFVVLCSILFIIRINKTIFDKKNFYPILVFFSQFIEMAVLKEVV